MRIMLVDANNRYMIDEHGQILFSSKPDLGFPYEKLVYNDSVKLKWLSIGTKPIQAAIEEPERELIEKFMDQAREQHGVKVLAVDAQGFFLGHIRNDDPRIAKIVVSGPPNGDDWAYIDDAWTRVYFYDSEGRPIPGSSNNKLGWTTVTPPNTAGRLPYKWVANDGKWVLDNMSDDQWKSIVEHEVLSTSLLGFIQAVQVMCLKSGNEKLASEYISGLLPIVAKYTDDFNKAQPTPKMAALNGVVTELDALVESAKSGSVESMQRGFYDFKMRVEETVAQESAALPVNVADVILDEYTLAK